MPQAPPTSPFPVFAFIAPIVAAALMWFFTRSPFVLVFAVLGPVIAVATMADSRRRAKADLRRHVVSFEHEIESTIRVIDDAHRRERQELERKAGCSMALIDSAVRDPERWRGVVADGLVVRLGAGTVSSEVVLEDSAAAAAESADAGRDLRLLHREPQRRLNELRQYAGLLADAPVVTDATLGIGIYGSRTEVAAVATSIAIQLAAALSPADFSLSVHPDSGGVFDWAGPLPHSAQQPELRAHTRREHRDSPHTNSLVFRSRKDDTAVVLVVANEESALPRECRVVVCASGSRARIVRQPDRAGSDDFVPDYISQRQAERFVETLQSAAQGLLAHGGRELPKQVALHEMLRHSHRHYPPVREDNSAARVRRDSLEAAVGMGAEGPVRIDLVADGPHAIVGGTTGSGKSEVLVTWILSLAHAYPPKGLNFLLIDFKGGAAFSSVQDLPHTVGVLTDLDPEAARRAILSLKAELRRREKICADAHARSIAELPCDVELARLVIVVDEFATMSATFGEMNDLFADLAARGRSLGIHLILCTQRPSESIRDAVLANCSLRISLRVNNSADSTAVVGTAGASQISQHLPGRSLLVRGTANVESVQWAMAGAAEARRIAESAGSFPIPQRPWLDPLPRILELAAVSPAPVPAIAFGLIDIPEEQRQVPAVFDPVSDGNLLIVGAHRSGKSTVLATLAYRARDAVTVPSGVEGAWDAVTTSLAAVRSGTGPSLIMIDDIDLTAGQFGHEYESEFLDRVTSLVREGPRSGTSIVLTASALKGRVQSVSALCSSTLLLRMRDRQDHVLAGGDGAEFSPHVPPGGGFWRGHRVQVCFSVQGPRREASNASPIVNSLSEVTVVISTHPEAIRSRLDSLGQVAALDVWRTRSREDSELEVDRGSAPTIILGDPDAWLSSAVLLGNLRSRCTLIFHDCSCAEFRSLSRCRDLPPPVAIAHNTAIAVHPDGQMHRVKFPG